MRSKSVIFSWISFVSVGGLLSLFVFLTGAQNLAEFLVRINLRSVVHLSSANVFKYDDTFILVSSYEVENLPPSGVPVRARSVALRPDGSLREYRDESPIAHPHNVSVDYATIYTAEAHPVARLSYEKVFFCNTTARFKFGIPLYHYNTGVTYGLKNGRPFEFTKVGPMYHALKPVAIEHGILNPEVARHYELGLSEFHSEGITLNWDYCDTTWAPPV